MVEGVAISAGNAGMRPVTVPAAPSACLSRTRNQVSCPEEKANAPRALTLEVPMQPGGGKSAPPARRRGCDGEGAGGEGAYVHTPIGTSPAGVYVGRTIDGIERKRKRERFKHIAACSFALMHGGEEEAGKALLSCGRYFQRINFPCGIYKLLPFPCDSVFCPECAARRAKPLQKKIWDRMDRKEHDYWMATVTIKNQKVLDRPLITNFTGNMAKLRESQLWKEQVSGGMYSLEATYNRKAVEWHPHAHVLIETGKNLPKDWIFKLQKEWLGITGDSHVINLEPLYSVTKKGRKTRNFNRRALREIVKYSTKAADFSDKPECVLEFFKAFKGVRRVQSFGSFLGAVKEAEKEASEEHTKEPVGCLCGMCKWSDGKFIAKVHITDTFLLADGSRQLKLFEPGAGPPELPPLDWIPEKEFQTREAKRMQPLLFVGPLFEGPYASFV